LVATLDGTLVGSNFATRWGSVGFFGPLTIRPDLWDGGIGRKLMAPVMAQFEAWQAAHAGLFTFAHSTKHVGLYERFGFAAPLPHRDHGEGARRSGRRRRTALLRPVSGAAAGGVARCTRSSRLRLVRGARPAPARSRLVARLGLANGAGSDGRRRRERLFAICHYGPGEGESGADTAWSSSAPCGGRRPSALRPADRCLRGARGAGRPPTVMAGANMGRPEAYAQLKRRGYRAAFQGVTMHKPNESRLLAARRLRDR
jgi:hypothetical protein